MAGTYTTGRYAGLAKTASTINSESYSTLKTTLSHKAAYYEQELNSLKESLENGNLSPEDRRKYRSSEVQSIALELATDFSMLAQYKLDSPSSYMDKTIDPFIQYLRDVRATLNLIINADEA